jgi:hypothetical protein
VIGTAFCEKKERSVFFERRRSIRVATDIAKGVALMAELKKLKVCFVITMMMIFVCAGKAQEVRDFADKGERYLFTEDNGERVLPYLILKLNGKARLFIIEATDTKLKIIKAFAINIVDFSDNFIMPDFVPRFVGDNYARNIRRLYENVYVVDQKRYVTLIKAKSGFWTEAYIDVYS